MFFLPVGVTLILVLIGLALRRFMVIFIGVVVLWLSSTPWISGLLVRSAEGWIERGQAIDAPKADLIVVLSGGRIVAPGKAAISEWIDADRFYGGVELFKAGKAPFLVFTGGWVPWQPTAKSEGEILLEYAKLLGIHEKHMFTTGAVMNTEEEAQAVAAFLSEQFSPSGAEIVRRDVLLVTSAFHMPRAKLLFERAGMNVIPFSVDFQVPDKGQVDLLDLMPSANAIKNTEMALREFYGRVYYRLRVLW